MDLPLRPFANRFGGCFCLGSGPVFWVLLCFLLFASLFPLAKRKSGWGICASSFFVWLCFSAFFNRFADSKDLFVLVQCIFCLLSCKDRAISATSATLEEKNVCSACCPVRSSIKQYWKAKAPEPAYGQRQPGEEGFGGPAQFALYLPFVACMVQKLVPGTWLHTCELLSTVSRCAAAK